MCVRAGAAPTRELHFPALPLGEQPRRMGYIVQPCRRASRRRRVKRTLKERLGNITRGLPEGPRPGFFWAPGTDDSGVIQVPGTDDSGVIQV